MLTISLEVLWKSDKNRRTSSLRQTAAQTDMMTHMYPAQFLFAGGITISDSLHFRFYAYSI